ncbi:hypothetical protein EVAR_100449_1 [Eumeta japonica]|uniref:Uncharacterized protein n=1 Tax=Eumeta variegata TaxID=151549 RepID=A0A4C2A151_EUMVA|nr:hypothetical protein EVAR_100449_1 [Eumeta japonica]
MGVIRPRGSRAPSGIAGYQRRVRHTLISLSLFLVVCGCAYCVQAAWRSLESYSSSTYRLFQSFDFKPPAPAQLNFGLLTTVVTAATYAMTAQRAAPQGTQMRRFVLTNIKADRSVRSWLEPEQAPPTRRRDDDYSVECVWETFRDVRVTVSLQPQ